MNDNVQEIYCQLKGTEAGVFTKKITIELDLGEKQKLFENIVGKSPLADEDGKIIKFNSMIDALNHMAKDGWFFVNAYCITIGNGSQNIYHYVMRKKIEK